MKTTIHLQKELSKTPPPPELIQRSLKHPTTPRSSPLEHPSTPEPSNSQPDHPMETPANPLWTPRGSGSQTLWEQTSPHLTPTRQAVSPYIVCLPLQERDVQEEESSSHKDPQQPLFPLYPLSQHSLFGAPRATCLEAPLGLERPNPHTPRSSRDYLMPVPAEDTPVETRQTLLEATRQTLPEATRRDHPRDHPAAVHPRDHPEATHLKDHLVVAHLRDHPVAAHLKGHLGATHLKDHPAAAHPRDHPVAAHLRDLQAAVHPKDHPVAAHLRDLQVAVHPKDHPVAAHLRDLQAAVHPRDHPVAALPRDHQAVSLTPGDKLLPDRQARRAPQVRPEHNPPLSQCITHSLSRHQHRPGSKSPNQRTSRENPRRPKSS